MAEQCDKSEMDDIHPNASEDKEFEGMYEKINGIQIYYEKANIEKMADRKVAMLFVHGWTANRLRLHPLYILYRNQGTPIFRLDLRGHGWSQKTAIEDFSIKTMVKDLEEFIQKVIITQCGFEKVIIVSHSMGGSITQQIAITQPKFLEKVVLLNPFASLVPQKWKRFLFPLFVRNYRKNYWKKYLGKKPGHVPWGLEHFPMWSDEYNTMGRTLFTQPEATLQGLTELSKFDSRKNLHKINVPVLVMTGELDTDASPACSKELHELIPNSKMHIVPGVNHDLALGKSKTCKKLIDEFLASD